MGGAAPARSMRNRASDNVVEVRFYNDVKEPNPAKKRRFFKAPPTSEATQLQRWMGVRPPLLPKSSRGANFRRTPAASKLGDGVFQLSDGHVQRIERTINEDEAFLRETSSGGNLPV